MRLVLDTNVIVSAIIAQGVPYELLQTAHKKGFDIYTTIELLDELDVVLRRTKFAPVLGNYHKIPILRPKHVLQNIKFRSGVP